jgi:methionyl-tRNA formyltransferase
VKLVFCGTPEFAVPSLRAVVQAGHRVELVLTQPDRAVGRKQELHAPEVKVAALELGLAVEQPEKIKANAELRARLTVLQPDAIVVVAYGRILPLWMLELPRFGCINVHGSLLPKYRGAAPIQWAIANGETETGVTTMRLDVGLDTGDTLLMQSFSVGEDTTSQEIYPQLSQMGAELLLKTLEGLADGSVIPQPQDHSRATLAPILSKEDGLMKLEERGAVEVYNRWRGFSPWPGAYASLRGRRFLVHAMRPVDGGGSLAAGELDARSGDLLVGAAGGTMLRLDEVQLEGKARMSGVQFARDFQLQPGERLA